MEVNIRKKIIKKGCWISISTKKPAVSIITQPMIIDLVAAAPTNPITISNEDNGEARIS